MIYETLKDYLKARDAYEKVLEVQPDSGAALNNLSYVYAEHLVDLGQSSQHWLKEPENWPRASQRRRIR